ncbi:helix-turn-helix transcriptional regulator [Pseudonocardia sp. K10HN5]|uniref:Helix-turn-helix transcriptional regulator n=2 Tax=Pseudonocardia acidicola TaxID=2724939 RepID=A0ABX1SAE3_9PSEU|nr:helix-turn-helix transcriptional regulator [Pseudonocardia acidicola]
MIAEILNGDQPRCVVIAGGAGVGKTRLAREALAEVQDRGRPTRWAAATVAASAIPLGALAHLLPAAEGASGPLALLQGALSALGNGGCGERMVVGIDDAHLLDDLSVALVHQVALVGTVAVVLTARTGEQTPGGLAALWKDGVATRIELTPLGRADTDELVQAVLGGIVDARTTQRLWEVSRGNPLYLRELIANGRATGSLRCRDGVWHWDGISVTSRLSAIVREHLGELDPAQREVLEVIAAAEPLAMDRLLGLVPPTTVAALERRRLVSVDRERGCTEVRLAHPLHAEVIRALTPETAARRLRRRLTADGNPSVAGCRPPDSRLLRAGELALDGDEPVADARQLTDAAVQAGAAFEHDLADRLARAAIAAGAGFPAYSALLDALHWQGRAAEVEQLAAAAAPLARRDDERAQLAGLRARTLLCEHDVAAADVIVAEAEAAVSAEGPHLELIGIRGLLAFFEGRCAQAVELGTRALAGIGDNAPGPPQAWAALAAGLAVGGRCAAALGAARSGRDALMHATAGPAPAFTRLVLATAELLALSLAGKIGELEHRAAELHRDAMRGPAWAGDAVAALHMGCAALAAGRAPAAVRWLTEAGAGLRPRDPVGMQHLCTAQLAQAHAVLGDTEATGRLLAGLDTCQRRFTVFEPHALLAKAWHLAADGHPARAVEVALQAAAVAADGSQWAVEARARHAVVRLGRAAEVAGRLRELAESIEGELVQVYSAHAHAAAAHAGGGLDEVAARFASLRASLLAAEAAGQAAAAHQQAGDRRRAAAATARATALARACGTVRTPALAALGPSRLTSRESEVAALARAGLHNRAIADSLVLSVRTVEAHLANVYAKLGINTRAQLRDALSSDSSLA